VAVALEWLILKRNLDLLDASYAVNALPTGEALDKDAMHRVLQSYLLIFRQGAKADFDIVKHQQMKQKAAVDAGWKDLVDFERQTVDNRPGPLGLPPLCQDCEASHPEMQDLVLSLALGYGKWQDTECRHMKTDLKALDPDRSGSVPLDAFRAFPGDPHYGYRFLESTDYLEKIGALEKTQSGEQRVGVANYLYGPSNCIASSAYVAVCCLSECEEALSSLEGWAHAPAQVPKRLMRMEAALPQASPGGASRQAGKGARDRKLFAVAEANGGAVPLHSAGFAEWAHSSLPYECAAPLSTDTPIHAMAHSQPETRTPLYMV
jgi:hypothetical protein